MTPQSANRHRRGRTVTAAVAGGVLAVGLTAATGSSIALADPSDPTPQVPTQVAPAAIVPNGVTGEAAKAAKAAKGAAAANPTASDPTAPVDPAVTPAVATEAPPQTAEELIAIIARDYDTGAGGGQISNLVNAVMQLRAEGFKPSKANVQELIDALDSRPNQGPLVAALKNTLAFQTKQKAQQDALQGDDDGGRPFTIGFMPGEPGGGGDFFIDPGS